MQNLGIQFDPYNSPVCKPVIEKAVRAGFEITQAESPRSKVIVLTFKQSAGGREVNVAMRPENYHKAPAIFAKKAARLG